MNRMRNSVPMMLLALLLAVVLVACDVEEDGPALVNTPTPAQQESTATESAGEPVDDAAEEEPEVAEDASPALDGMFAVGDVIEARGMWMSVNGFNFIEADEVEFLGPDPGNRFVIVDVTFENRSDSPKNISSLLQTELRDATGQRYTTDIMAITASGGSTLDGEVAPGDRLRGQAGFQVPVDATGLVFYYDAAVFGLGQQVRVQLGDEPQTADVPQQEPAAESADTDGVFAVGDVIEARGLWMMVDGVEFIEEDEVEFLGPEPGNRFVIVDVTFENQSDSPKHISSLLQTELRDSSGQRYTTSVTAITAASGSTLDGEIAPGDRLRGQAGFEVPVDATGLTFYFDAAVFGLGQQVRVALD